MVLAAVLVCAGVAVYLALPVSSTTTTLQVHSTCLVGTRPCRQVAHDATVFEGLRTVVAGTPLAFTAELPNSLLVTESTFWFGDGTTLSNDSATVGHTYSNAGQYLVYVQVVDQLGSLHDNLHSLLEVTVVSSFASDTLGIHLGLDGQLTANSSEGPNSPSGPAPQPTMPAGGWVNLSAWASGPPSNPSASFVSASFLLPTPASKGALQLGPVSGSGANPSEPLTVHLESVPGASAGDLPVEFSAATSLATTTSTLVAWSNFTFSIFLGNQSLGNGSVLTPPVAVSPHAGSLVAYELVPGGAVTTDPSIDYEEAGTELIENVYQTLITYNGTQAGPSPEDFVPELSTCVPGSTVGTDSCVAQYGSTMVTNNGGTFTFPINPNSRFYNPYSSDGLPQSYPVWPSDVVWSFARSCLYADFPSEGNNPGWIQCQALLPTGSQGFDNGLHYPFDSTPGNILSAITVNQTELCPAKALAEAGCVTFNTSASGASWPEFLEFVADPDGGAVQSCLWDQSQGWTLPGWTTCGGPPYASPPSDTAWDTAEQTGAPTSWNVKLSTQMVGSGPYYLAAYSRGQSYALKINPDYGGTSCPTPLANGCMPASGGSDVIGELVSVVWETTQSPGEAALAAGTADVATIPETDTATLLGDIAQGKAQAIEDPTLNLYLTGFNLAEAQGLAQGYTTVNVSAPSWMMQDLNMRQFLIHAFPYQTLLEQICTTQGIEFCEIYGGAIPRAMDGFYPTNISWPSGNPDSNPSDVGGAAWWWSQVASDNMDGPTCTQATPCTFPMYLPIGYPTDLGVYQDWAQWIDSLSGGAVQAEINSACGFGCHYDPQTVPPGDGPFSTELLSWLMDFPDPSDYVDPTFLPNSTFTYTAAWWQALEELPGPSSLAHQNYLAACSGPVTDPIVTTDCQGSAYAELIRLVKEADACDQGPGCSFSQRVLLYTLAENIEDQLGMYVWEDQTVNVVTMAAWISAISVNTNPAVPGQDWWSLQYLG